MKTYRSHIASAYLLLVICLMAGQSCLQAQDEPQNYDYRTFRFPEINRRALELFPSLSIDGTDSRNRRFGIPDKNSSYTTAGLNTQYGYFHNSLAEQIQHTGSLYQLASFSRIERTDPPSRSETNEYDARLSTEGINRFYYGKRRSFIEINWDIDAGYTASNHINTSLTDVRKERFYAYLFSVPLRFGWGRIEPIDDVFLAHFMADDMLEAGILEHPLPQESLFELGRVMADVRNQRIFDARKKRMYELAQLDSWFKDFGYAKVDNILYYKTLADNWLFGFNNTRFSGSRFSFGITPQADYWASHGQEPSVINMLAMQAIYEGSTPLNQHWQIGYTVQTELAFLSNENWLNNSVSRPGLSAEFKWGFYPNSRTRLTGYMGVDYQLFLRTWRKIPASETIAGLQMDYFINYRTRLVINLAGRHYRTPKADFVVGHPLIPRADAVRWNVSGALQLTYSFF